MDEKKPVDVNMMCRTIGTTVGPVRAGTFELLSHLMLASLDENHVTATEVLDPLFEAFEDCEKMLDTGVTKAVQESGLPMPKDLEANRLKALAATRALLSELRSVASGRRKPDYETFSNLTKMSYQELRPEIDGFLNALNAFSQGEAERKKQDSQGIIGSTIAEIDKISMSIKLISINASVEAAHAGDAGRGFAVIASEIQALSTKSQEALAGIRGQLL